MASVTLTVPDTIIPEIQAMADERGLANAKQLVIRILKQEIRNYRKRIAFSEVSMSDVDIT